MNNCIQLPFFPVPAEGETVFSVVGRCIERLGIANQHLMAMITGQKYSKALFSALPGYLGKIANAMPNGHPWIDVQTLIRSHTALPYFTYFHTGEQRNSSEQLLAIADNSQPVALSLGLSLYRVPVMVPSVRFCMACLYEQYREPGHSYFQLAHQLPGVTHCWNHGELLSHGCIRCGTYPIKGKKLTMPGQCLCGSFSAAQIEAGTKSPRSAHWLARESAYLLTAADSSFDRRRRLREGIIQAGLCRGSHVDYDRLAEAIEARFGAEFLLTINYPTRDESGRPSAWIRRSLPSAPIGKRLSTIVGLLILGAAFDSVEAFEKCSVSKRSQAPQEVVSPESATAPSWTANLKELLAAHDYRISTCAARLEQSSWNIAIEARNQQITIPLTPSAVARIGKDRLKTIRTLLRHGVEKDEILRTQRISRWTLQLIELDDLTLTAQHRTASKSLRHAKHRKRVLDFLNDHPEATRQTISTELAGAYDFLIGKDKTWFLENVPKATRTPSGNRPQRNDWGAIDRSLAEATQATGNELLSSDERPIRITASLLLSRHRSLQRYSAQPSRFPYTRRVIGKLAETSEQYLRRKVTWGIRRLIGLGMPISMDALRRETAIPDAKLKQNIDMVRHVAKELGARFSKRSILHSPTQSTSDS